LTAHRISPVQAVKAGKLEDRYENALGALLNQEAQARAGANGRETAMPATSST
jgi:hypothetical protein